VVPKNNKLSITVCDLQRLFQVEMDEKLLTQHLTEIGCDDCSWLRYFEMLSRTLQLSEKSKDMPSLDDENSKNMKTKHVYIEMAKGAAYVILHLDYPVDDTITLRGQIQLLFVEEFQDHPSLQHQTLFSLFEIAIKYNYSGNNSKEKKQENENKNENEHKNLCNDENSLNKENVMGTGKGTGTGKEKEKIVFNSTSISLEQYMELKQQNEQLQQKLNEMTLAMTMTKISLSQSVIKNESLPSTNGSLSNQLESPNTKIKTNTHKNRTITQLKQGIDIINPRRKVQRTPALFQFGQS